MKNLINFINESKTTGRNIQDYGKSWTIEWTPEYFKDMFNFFINGLSLGLEDNLKAYKDDDNSLEIIKNDIQLIEEIKKIINKNENNK